MQASPCGTTLLFTDIEGSTRLWEQEGARMPGALAGHDAVLRAAVESNRGTIVKTTGDGIYAAFGDSLDAVNATLALQQALGDPKATNGILFRVRCGLHLGVVERRDGDLFGSPVNRASRIMSAAHGGQVLLSQAVVDHVGKRLPPLVSLCDLGGVRLRDLAKSEHVYQLVHPSLREDFPALRSLEATPTLIGADTTGRHTGYALGSKYFSEIRVTAESCECGTNFPLARVRGHSANASFGRRATAGAPGRF